VSWELVRWLHLLAMAFFVGGQLVLVAAVVPAFRGHQIPASDNRVVHDALSCQPHALQSAQMLTSKSRLLLRAAWENIPVTIRLEGRKYLHSPPR